MKPFPCQKKSTLSNIKPIPTPSNIKPCLHEERVSEEKALGERELKGESESLTQIGEINSCLNEERASEEQKFNGR
jgi:hypothetical protein